MQVKNKICFLNFSLLKNNEIDCLFHFEMEYRCKKGTKGSFNLAIRRKRGLFRNWGVFNVAIKCTKARVSVQGVKSIGGHFACLCLEFDFYEVKNIYHFFQKEKGNTFTLLITFTVKSLQKEQNSTNLLLWPPICWNKVQSLQSESTSRRLTLVQL